jgi:hypothetical protein
MIGRLGGVRWVTNTLLMQRIIETAVSKDHGDNIRRKEANIAITTVDSGQRNIPDDIIEGDESRNLTIDGMLRVSRRFKQS